MRYDYDDPSNGGPFPARRFPDIGPGKPKGSVWRGGAIQRKRAAGGTPSPATPGGAFSDFKWQISRGAQCSVAIYENTEEAPVEASER
jgi:hypothetical protein